jgi:hypothetical protein
MAKIIGFCYTLDVPVSYPNVSQFKYLPVSSYLKLYLLRFYRKMVPHKSLNKQTDDQLIFFKLFSPAIRRTKR